MYCPDCGSYNEDNAEYCVGCGTKFEYVNVSTAKSVIEKVKKFIASPIVLILCILFTISAVGGLGYNILTVDDSVNSALAEVGSMGGVDVNLQGVTKGAAAVGIVIGAIPSVLLAVGFWIMYANARSEGAKTSGLSLVRGVSVFNLVIVCIVAGLCGLACLVVIIAGAISEPLALGIGIAATIIFGAVFSLSIIMYSKAIRLLETVRNTLKTGIPSGNISTFVEVLCFIFGGINALAALTQLASSPVAFLLNGAGAACYIIFGVLINTYKSMIKNAALPVMEAVELVNENNNINNI